MIRFFKKWYLVLRLKLEIFELEWELSKNLENLNRRNEQFNLEMDVKRLHHDMKKLTNKQISGINTRIRLVKQKKV